MDYSLNWNRVVSLLLFVAIMFLYKSHADLLVGIPLLLAYMAHYVFVLNAKPRI